MSFSTDKRQHPFSRTLTRKDEMRIMAGQLKLRLYYYRVAGKWELWSIGVPVVHNSQGTRHRVFYGTWHECYNYLVCTLHEVAVSSEAASHEFTCSGCIGKFDCKYAFNVYCTDGDCLAEK